MEKKDVSKTFEDVVSTLTKTFSQDFIFFVNNSNAEERLIKFFNKAYHNNCFINFSQYIRKYKSKKTYNLYIFKNI